MLPSLASGPAYVWTCSIWSHAVQGSYISPRRGICTSWHIHMYIPENPSGCGNKQRYILSHALSEGRIYLLGGVYVPPDTYICTYQKVRVGMETNRGIYTSSEGYMYLLTHTYVNTRKSEWVWKQTEVYIVTCIVRGSYIPHRRGICTSWHIHLYIPESPSVYGNKHRYIYLPGGVYVPTDTYICTYQKVRVGMETNRGIYGHIIVRGSYIPPRRGICTYWHIHMCIPESPSGYGNKQRYIYLLRGVNVAYNEKLTQSINASRRKGICNP